MEIPQNDDTPPSNGLQGLRVRSETLRIVITPIGPFVRAGPQFDPPGQQMKHRWLLSLESGRLLAKPRFGPPPYHFDHWAGLLKTGVSSQPAVGGNPARLTPGGGAQSS